MAILKFELRQLRNSTFWWSVSSVLLVFLLFPAYSSMLGSGDIDIGAMSGNSVLDVLGVDASVITSTLGVYGYLTSFFAIAAGINGMLLGLKAFTKETVGKSAEFLYTKPYKRGLIFSAKVSASLLSAAITGASYYAGSILCALASIPEKIDLGMFSLISLSFMLISLFFVLLGALIGAVYSKIRTPLLLSFGIVFVFYMFSSFASKMNITFIQFLSPFSYFGASKIVTSGSYGIEYVSALIALCVGFTVFGFAAFIKKDVSFMS
jgi:ABC-2 type transport system permease protein